MRLLQNAALFAAVTIASVALSPSKGDGQTLPPPAPAPSASPSPAATAAPNPIGPALGANDPCTSLSAIVGRPSVTRWDAC